MSIDEATIEKVAQQLLRERHPCWSIVCEIFDKDSDHYNLDGQADEMRSVARAVAPIIEAALRKPPADAERAALVGKVRDLRDYLEPNDSGGAGVCDKAAALITADGERIAALEAALVTFRDYGCPVCGGDCGSANPPVNACPMQMVKAALKGPQT